MSWVLRNTVKILEASLSHSCDLTIRFSLQEKGVVFTTPPLMQHTLCLIITKSNPQWNSKAAINLLPWYLNASSYFLHNHKWYFYSFVLVNIHQNFNMEWISIVSGHWTGNPNQSIIFMQTLPPISSVYKIQIKVDKDKKLA